MTLQRSKHGVNGKQATMELTENTPFGSQDSTAGHLKLRMNIDQDCSPDFDSPCPSNELQWVCSQEEKVQKRS